jgi:predicted phage replisome organizer
MGGRIFFLSPVFLWKILLWSNHLSDNKKYYYLKFKENYFEQDHIKALEALENGYIYSLILIKLYLKAVKHEGQLRINEFIPYKASDVSVLAKVIGHDPDHVMKAINGAKSLGIIEIVDSGDMWISDIQNFIGQSSTEGDRKRIYRQKLAQITDNSGGGQMSDERPPELELELEIESEIIHVLSPLKDKPFKITKEYYHTLVDTYSKKDVLSELKKMNCWLEANPSKRKTSLGAKKFITNWLVKDPPNYGPPPPKSKTITGFSPNC